jgi:hypothetical protein
MKIGHLEYSNQDGKKAISGKRRKSTIKKNK